ncbi:hypothetical protein BDQ17DRAFT_52832 [Cyathus striatus]|nr:hypothetical protein BDQ17DRAFT_52832 [Cyathus striatus]
MPSPAVSIYRTYLRQIRQLPHLYLRQFFRARAEYDVRRVSEILSVPLFNKNLKRISKDIRKLQDAVRGDTNAFAHILNIAYGRKGKLWWELMQPLINNSKGHLPPLIISSVERSRPPVYSPELTALVTSAYSRTTTKPLNPRALQSPPTLPSQACADTQDAQLLGALSKRREVNIRWRYFSQQCKKVLPPLEITTAKQTNEMGIHIALHNFGFHNAGVTEGIQHLVGQYCLLPTPTRKQRTMEVSSPDPGPNPDPDINLPRKHPSRWIRRRYQTLLQHIPIMEYTSDGKFSVELSPSGHVALHSGSHLRLPGIDRVSSKWYSTSVDPSHEVVVLN